ncbi:MAG: O-antigen ligase family protein [Opitutaceae bacterium]
MSTQPLTQKSAAGWIAAALATLPFLQALPVDFDRSGALILLLPGLWAGRGQLTQIVARMRSGPAWLRFSAGAIPVAVTLSVAMADQPSPALVTAASWVILAAAGLIVAQLVGTDASSSRRLLAGMALGTAAGSLAVWALWWLGDRGMVPLYAHPRHLGLHTLSGALASTWLFAHSRETRPRRIFWAIVGTASWGGLLWSGGRTPLLALAGALVLWWIFSATADRKALVRATALFLFLGLALSSAFWTSRPELGWWHALHRTATAAANGSTSELTSTRNDFWGVAAGRARAAPWLGHGPDSYRFLTPKLDGQQPHNFVLQLWLEVGIVGMLPALVLLGGALLCGWPLASRSNDTAALAWLAILSASVAAGLLDGVFYHLVAFLPAALAMGAALGLGLKSRPPAKPSPAPHVILGAAGVIIALHMFLFYSLALATPPAPSAWPARWVRAFPSSTFGLWRWLDTWQIDNPDVALEWARWAQGHSPNPIVFHVYAARLLLAQGHREAAESELRAAESKAHWSTRPAIQAMLRELPPASP